MEVPQIVDEIAPKKYRHRKKLLYSSICEQMEFYFSDANLSKDRFIAQLVAEDPFVDLSVFLKFNKIRRLTDTISDLCKAISKSNILELSEDNSKVRRKTEVQVKENQDECTIYVERLPADAEHDWVKNVFLKFGPIDYISIPRYKHNKMIKGFAFIEFQTPEIAQKVLEYYESIGCKLPTTMLPEQLVSISTFESENEKQNNILNQFNNEIQKENNDNNIKIKENETKKRKITEVESELQTNDVKKNKKDKQTPNNEVSKQTNEAANQTNEQTTSEQINEIEESVDKKKRKRKKHKKSVNDSQLGLQVLSKKEWKQLRNKYLNLQKQKMKNLKEHLRNGRFAVVNNTENSENKSTPRFEFTPGLIIRFELSDPLNDVKKFKNDIKSNPGLEYIDVTVGNNIGYLRFSDKDNAQKFCESDFNGFTTILEGEDEKQYWEKILEDRDNKLKKEGRKQRGRDKLLRKAEKELGKHIRFENAE